MLGAIIGDVVGSRWEFDPTNDYDFEWLSKEASEDDMEDNGMSRYMENNDEEGWD